MIKSKFFMAAIAAIVGFGVLSGCSQETKENLDATGDSMAKDAKVAADNAGDAAAGAAVTGKIKGALMSAEGVDSEHINVDTVGTTVTLKGSVDSEAAKAKAEQIAKDQAGSEYTVTNELTVGQATPADPTKNN
jgi:osmotically-inducible protein OsmY